MNDDDLAKVEKAMRVRSHKRWCTPSGAFLDLLRRFAREEKIAEIASACQMYFSKYNGSRNFVASALPAIILNHYKPFTQGDYTTFLKWSKHNEDWSNQIRENASSSQLVSVVEQLKTSIQRF